MRAKVGAKYTMRALHKADGSDLGRYLGSQERNLEPGELIQGTGSSNMHLVPDFYGVYLLRSSPKPKLFYIGSTPNPERRRKQHNGQLVNGAYKTKRDGFRPWDMIVVVSGFPSKISALQFEHAYQHPHITRHIPPESRLSKTSRSGSNSIYVKLGNLRLLLQSAYFLALNLVVNIIDSDAMTVWNNNKFAIDVDVEVAVYETFDDFLSSIETRTKRLQETASVLKERLLTVCRCATCDGKIDFLPDTPTDLPLVTITECCKEIHHLICILDMLLPKLYTCSCGRNIPWVELVLISGKVRHHFAQ